MTSPALSVLDLVPVRSDQTTGDALAASISLAQTADEVGMRRYWVAEHHNMPAVGATNPPVLIAMIAAATERIRVGSGGVMLPNHAPMVVAEQFALLEAAHPGRIDLGIGRAPGSDQVTSFMLRGGNSDEEVARFPRYVEEVMTMMSPDGAGIDLRGQVYELRATPKAVSAPPVWLLGSSDYSARLAGGLGLPYVFAHHFAGRGTAEALDLYRSTFRPSGHAERPTTFLTVNLIVAQTEDEAWRLAMPNQQSMLALRTGQPLHPQRLVEEAEAVALDERQRGFVDALSADWVIGTPDQAAKQITALAQEFDVDEVMLHPIAGAHEGTRADRSPAREQSLRLLAEAL
ncbi:MAG: LLM class flavin-dependent oxidoreductase [Actinomycetales bacterium]